MRTTAVVVAACAAAALLTGCGSSSAATPAVKGAAATGYPTRDVVSAIAADPKLTAELPAADRKSGSLILGTTLTPGLTGLPHAGVLPNGTSVGVDVDLRDAIARILGITWTVRNGTFPTIIPGVQNGRYDVGQDNFGATAAREKVVDITSYLTDGQAFLVPSDSRLSTVGTITDLCGSTVATSPGSTFQQILTDGAAKCAAAGRKAYTVQYFADTAPIWLGLANGKVDVYFGPTLSLQYDATHVPNTKFLNQFSSTPVGFVTGKGSPVAKALRDAVNELISDGDYARILGKWGVTSSGIPASVIDPASAL